MSRRRRTVRSVSLSIDPDKVVAVLLADGWHDVGDGMALDLDAYEFVERDEDGERTVLHGGGQSGICATGFRFVDAGGKTIAGPLTSILAVETATDR